MTSLKGAHCILLSCSHIFCRPCLQDFWGLFIKEGDVGKVGCADPECVKAGREATEEEVRRVVSEEEVKRWQWLWMKRAIEKGACDTITFGPKLPYIIALFQIRQSFTVLSKAARHPYSNLREKRLAGIVYEFVPLATIHSAPSVSVLGASFPHLRMPIPVITNIFTPSCTSWYRHGPLSACPASFTLAIVREYLSLQEGSPQRSVLERKYGKGVVQKLVQQYQEEESNKAWLQNSTTPCPGCKVHVEKNAGCNHVSAAIRSSSS